MKKALSVLTTVALCASTLSAMQFQTLGYKSVGMGGAAVASSSGSCATYNNPALLAKAPYTVEVLIGGGVAFEDHGAGASVKELDDSGFLDTVDKISDDLSQATQSDIDTLIKGKDIIIGMNGDAVSIDPQVEVAAQIGNFGFGIFGSSNGVGTAIVDQTRDQLIFKDSTYGYARLTDDGEIVASSEAEYNQLSIEYALNNNTTYLDIKGLAIAEVPLAYGYSLDISSGHLMIGGAIKYMRGISYTEQYKIDYSGEVSGSEGKRDKTTNTFGVDLGVAFEPTLVKDLTIGLVGKNLNTPEFDVVDNGDAIKVKPLFRFGLAYDVFDSLEVAFDYDLTANETLVADYKSQMLGGGINWHPSSWFALRCGLMQNMHSSDTAGVVYTAGIGLGLKWLQLDLSGQYSSNETTIDGTTVPEYAKINLALISRW